MKSLPFLAALVVAVADTFSRTAAVTQILSVDVTNKPYIYEARDTYAPKVSEAPASASMLHHSFPAHSFTQIVVGVGR